MLQPDQSQNDRSRDLLVQAQKAARDGDPHGMIEALAASGFMDGLIYRLTAQWGRQIGQEEIRDIVAHAVDAAFDAISKNKPVKNLGGWLWKAASNEISDRWRDDHKPRVNTANVDNIYAGPAPITDAERAVIDDQRDHCRDEAIRMARRLLPSVGDGQVRDVMKLLIDAVEQGLTDLPASTIADALGIEPASARTLLSRGFSRLTRAARAEGIEWPASTEADDFDDINALNNHTEQLEDQSDAE